MYWLLLFTRCVSAVTSKSSMSGISMRGLSGILGEVIIGKSSRLLADVAGGLGVGGISPSSRVTFICTSGGGGGGPFFRVIPMVAGFFSSLADEGTFRTTDLIRVCIVEGLLDVFLLLWWCFLAGLKSSRVEFLRFFIVMVVTYRVSWCIILIVI